VTKVVNMTNVGSAPPRKDLKPLKLGGVLMLLCVYVFWGGTYLGIRVAVETIPHFLMAGTRFLLAGAVVYLYAMLRGARSPSREHWFDAGIVGALLLLAGNGVVSWAEQLVSSSMAALLIATVPLWMLLMGLFQKGGKRPNALSVTGILLGFSGIAVLVAPSGGDSGSINLAGGMALLVAAFFWALGSIYSRGARLPASPLLSVGMQMIVGGILLLVVSGLLGEWSRVEIARITARSMIGMAYLVLFGSIVAYNAYIWLLKNADPIWVSTYAFVNPIVAVFLGWFLAHEPLTVRSLAATAIIVLSVVIITINKNLENQVAEPLAIEE
jgi:drug/metabolite transporter (DMT)-like permease